MKHLKSYKIFESIEGDVDYIRDILFNISDCDFKSKSVEYDPNRYFTYHMERKKSEVLFFWTNDFRRKEKDFLHGLYLYKEQFVKLFSYHIHYILFNESFILFIMVNSPKSDPRVDVSKRFVRDVFSPVSCPADLRPEYIEITNYIKDGISNAISGAHIWSSDFFKANLSSGIRYKDGGSSNLALFDWEYKDYKPKP